MYRHYMNVCIFSDSSVYFNHVHLKMPSSKDDIISIVRAAAVGDQKVRVVGSGHSWSAVAASDDILVSLWNYTGIVCSCDYFFIESHLV